MSRVVAVIVHWQDPEDTLGCVESLRGEDVDVIVVDNGSRAPVGPLLAARAPEAACLHSAVNLGYAGGANLGIRAALERDPAVVVLLNNDVRVLPGANVAALRVIDADPRVAVVGAKVLTREDPSRLWLAWGRVTWRQSLVALEGADVPDGPRFAEQRDVEWIGGCTMWFRATALERIGLLDEEFFAYHEEVDWCVRAREHGLRVVYAPDAVVTHTGRGTAGGGRSVRIRKYFGARNTILFARKHAGGAEWVRLAAWLGISLPLQLVWHALRGHPGEAWIKVRGLADAIAGRRPPLEELGLR